MVSSVAAPIIVNDIVSLKACCFDNNTDFREFGAGGNKWHSSD